MAGKLQPKIIIEGTRLTGKTDLAFALNEHPRIVGPRRYRYHSPLISAEWCAFSEHPWGEGLINFGSENEARALDTYRTWVRLFELQCHYSWIVDRFHLATVVHQRRRGRTLDFRWLERRLVRLGFVLVLCTRPDDSFESARIERLKVSGKPDQYDDLGVFIDEQAQLRQLARMSMLPSLEVDLSTGALDGACQRIADWMAI